IILAIVLFALAVGLLYNRRRLAAPFARIVVALERVATGTHAERLDESQPEEFGIIARSVNQMAASLAWRERMQEHIARLLTALNAPTGGGGGGDAAVGGFGPTLEVLAGASSQPTSARCSSTPRPTWRSRASANRRTSTRGGWRWRCATPRSASSHRTPCSRSSIASSPGSTRSWIRRASSRTSSSPTSRTSSGRR